VVRVIGADPDGEGLLESPVTEYAWDAAGQLISETDPLGRVTSYEYNELGQLVKVTLPDPDGEGQLESPEIEYLYDKLDNLRFVIDALGNTTEYQYDYRDRVVLVIAADPDGAGGQSAPQTAFTYDLVGNRTSLTDPVGNTTVWVYDGLDRVIEETNELAATRYFQYDAVGNLVEKTDRNGRVIEYVHDNLNRTIEETWLDGMSVVRTIAYEWDAAGQLLSATDDDSSYQYEYDLLGRVIEIMIDNGGPIVVLTQGFDANGNRTSLAAEIDSVDDFLTNYTFDGLGRITRITQEGQSGGNTVAEKRVDLSYLADGRFDTISRYKDLDGGSGNLIAESIFAYDLMGRLTDLEHGDGTTTIDAFGWTYDLGNRITQFTSLQDGTSDYSYDNTSQLVGADHGYQTDEDYEFDENGNRVMSGYVIGDNNQLLSDGTWDYDYDDEGNTILKTRISNDPADDYTVEYEWDHHNRLIGVKHRDNYGTITMSAIYVYDAFDRRIAKIVDLDGTGGDPAETTQFIHDGDHIALAFDGNDDLIRRFLHGPVIDQILAEENVAEDELLWMLADNLGSVRTVVDNDSTVINHITYSAFGALTGETNPVDQFFYFTGRELDKETGDQYNRRRFYGSDIGQWRSTDPIGFEAGDANDRRYVGNNPINFVDAHGLADHVSGIGTVGGRSRIHVVQPGESLFDVARRRLGSAAHWAKIYDLNKDALGIELEDLPVGLELILPFTPQALAVSVPASPQNPIVIAISVSEIGITLAIPVFP
jgi:RHS repeat-associated protein